MKVFTTQIVSLMLEALVWFLEIYDPWLKFKKNPIYIENGFL